jgi:hypothetical protein
VRPVSQLVETSFVDPSASVTGSFLYVRTVFFPRSSVCEVRKPFSL